jgi:hypothetical protein
MGVGLEVQCLGVGLVQVRGTVSGCRFSSTNYLEVQCLAGCHPSKPKS